MTRARDFLFSEVGHTSRGAGGGAAFLRKPRLTAVLAPPRARRHASHSHDEPPHSYGNGLIRTSGARGRLLLVVPAGSYRVGDFLLAAEALRCEVVVASDAPSAVPGSLLAVTFDDPESAATILLRDAGEVDAVVGTDGDAVAVAGAVARCLGLPANPPAVLATSASKYGQRVAAAAAGVAQPAFQRVQLLDDAEGWSVFPAVVKPLDRSGSQGVVRADDPAGLADAVARVREIVGAQSPVLVEEMVDGVEVAVEGLLSGGRLEVLAVFDKPETPRGPTFPETLLVAPARLAAGTLHEVVGTAQRAAAAIGLMEGPVHVECMVDGDRVWFLELAARTIGGFCSRALLHGGVSLEELVIRHATGMDLPERTAVHATGVLMVPVPEAGRVTAVCGVDEARAVEGVTSVVMSVGIGEEVVPLPAGNRYAGFVFARGDSADDVEAALRAAWSVIELEVSASSAGSAGGPPPDGRSRR